MAWLHYVNACSHPPFVSTCLHHMMSFDVCGIVEKCFIITQLMRNVLKGKLSSFTCTHTLFHRTGKENEMPFSSPCNYNGQGLELSSFKQDAKHH